MRQEITLVVNNDNTEPVDDEFHCQGVVTKPVVSMTFINSEIVPLRVFPAKAMISPYTNSEGDKHEMRCQFPDSDVESKYSVTWKLNQQVRLLLLIGQSRL